MKVGERIRLARQRAGLTQKGLAERLGVTYVNISQWESGRRTPKWETLQKIANALDASVFELADENTVVDTKIDTSSIRNVEDINDPEELKVIIKQQQIKLFSESVRSLSDAFKVLHMSEQDEQLQILYGKIGMLSESKRKILEDLLDAMLENTTDDNAASED